jgi:hypothetical protein
MFFLMKKGTNTGFVPFKIFNIYFLKFKTECK